MATTNHHLNLFRFFNESSQSDFIENNLSRAFAICLLNDSFLLNECIRSIVTDEDYEYLFSSISDDSSCDINLQVDTAAIDKEVYKTVYAVAMTGDNGLSLDDFYEQEELDKKNITDLFISIKDIAIIIEIKRTGENCVRQLYNQVLPFIKEKEKFNIIPTKFSWHDLVKIMERIKHVQKLGNRDSIFVKHFLELSEIRYPDWFEPKPFNVLPFGAHGSTAYIQLQKRLRQALAGVSNIAGEKYQVLPFYDRLSLSLPFPWASELIPEFEVDPKSKDKEFIAFYIWPGNTKQQGWSVFSRPLDWLNKKTLLIDGSEYELDISYNVKLSHFMGKFISQINYYKGDVNELLHTGDNFRNQSGKWNRDDWEKFEQLMDKHFKQEFDWRTHCNWQDKFINSGKNYLFMSLGFEVCVYVPYSKFRDMDKKESDVTLVSQFINNVAAAFQNLI